MADLDEQLSSPGGSDPSGPGSDGPGAAGAAPEDPAERASATRAGLLVGLLISVVLSAALVIPAAKAGITPGVSPLVVLFGWVLFGAVMGPRLKRFLAIAQVTGSAGAAVTAGVVFTAPIIQVLYAELGLDVPPVDWAVLIVGSVAGSLLGFGFVGLATRRFLTDPRLPAPEAVAADRLIATAVENPDQRPRLLPSLFAGLVSGAAVGAMSLLEWVEEVAARAHIEFRNMTIELPVHVAPIYIGIGALLTLPTALLIFAGGAVNAVTIAYAASEAMPDTTFRWVGGAAMVVAVLYSLVAYVIEGRGQRAASERGAGGAGAGDAGAGGAGAGGAGAGGAGAVSAHDRTTAVLAAAARDTSLLEQSPRIKAMLYASIAAGTVLLLVMMSMVGDVPPTAIAAMGAVAFVLVFLLSGLGGLLSLQVGSSASPVSGTVFMGMLVLSITALNVGLADISGVVFLVPIVVAACVAICAANDSSQDYKTMQLNGFTVSDGFVGQLLGLLGGAVAVPLALWVAHNAYTLGSDKLNVPQASFFGTVLKSLFLDAEIPWGPVGVGAALGVVAVVVEVIGKARGMILSSLAFAVGIYLPAYIGVGIMLGALARFVATFKVQASTHEGILAAAGIITGDALAALIIGIFIIAGVDVEAWGPGEGGAFGKTAAQVFVGIFLGIVWLNYLQRRRRA